MDKRKLSRKAETTSIGGAGNSSAVSLETLHQLAASYFIDRESTLRRLHHIQIATAAIKVKLLIGSYKGITGEWRGEGIHACLGGGHEGLDFDVVKKMMVVLR